MDIHCVVTGQNESGKSVIVHNTGHHCEAAISSVAKRLALAAKSER